MREPRISRKTYTLPRPFRLPHYSLDCTEGQVWIADYGAKQK
jgi:hypothetical protein